MKFKSTGVFAVVVVGFLTYVYFVEYKGSQKKIEEEAEKAKIFAFKADDIQSFSIQRGEESVRVERGTDGWVLTLPVQDKADKEQVENFVSAVLNEKTAGVAAEGADIGWMIYGLEKPKATLEVSLKDNSIKKIALGVVIGVSGKRYIRVGEDNKVLMTEATLENELLKAAKEFREKSIFRVSQEKVKRVALTPVTAPVLSMLKADGAWALEGIYNEDSDKQEAQEFVGNLVNIQAQEFPAEDKLKFGLGTSTHSLSMDLDDGAKLNAQAFKAKDKYYLTVQDKAPVFEIAKKDYDLFSKTVNDLRDKKKPFVFEQSKVSQIDYKSEGLDLNLKKEGDKWTSKEPINNEKVKELFEKLGGMQVQKFYGKSNMYHPKGTITLKDQAGGIILDFKWGNEDTKNSVTVVKTNKHEETFGIPNTIVASLPGKTLLEANNTPKEEKHGEDHSHVPDTH